MQILTPYTLKDQNRGSLQFNKLSRWFWLSLNFQTTDLDSNNSPLAKYYVRFWRYTYEWNLTFIC